ncbi:helix-turn-helix domain-containing protein [Streptomyces sp. AD55]|uniref:helix-turn-helix domain-containing protein n=1 Tax=Streptomyces sp. AD55 TaxID=3242895 RepID=UPI0035289212
MGFFARYEDRTEVAAGQVTRQATASLAGLLAGLGKSRSDLAKAMGVSPGRVSQILSGEANLTVRTLAAAAEALDAEVQISFRPRPASGEAGTLDGTDSAPVRDGSLTSRR